MLRILLQSSAAIGFMFLAAMPAPSPADSREIYAKATHVDHAKQEIEVTFMTQPKETRMLCVGEFSGISQGDYVKLKIAGPGCEIGRAKLHAQQVTWKF